jgi:sigma-E factor negative regulatory protein RseB
MNRARTAPRRGSAHPAALTLAVALCGVVPIALAANPVEPAPRGAIDTPLTAANVVPRLREAAGRVSFTGTFVMQAGGAPHSLRITHVGGSGQPIDRIETLDGEVRHVFRHNERVHVLWPREHAAVIEPLTVSGSGYPFALQTQGELRPEVYEVQLLGPDRNAGLPADLVLLRPRDDWRYAQRLWLERRTGLLLRVDVLGPTGEVLESAGFSELHWDPRPQASALRAQMHQLKGYRVERPQLSQTDLEREGWALRQPPPGFRPQQTWRHPAMARAPGAAEPTSGDDAVVQAVYGDGITSVSLFIERLDPQRHQRPSAVTHEGATLALGQRSGNWWITAVGDVPRTTLQHFIAQIERRKP